jgi:hypothetical protein
MNYQKIAEGINSLKHRRSLFRSGGRWFRRDLCEYSCFVESKLFVIQATFSGNESVADRGRAGAGKAYIVIN